ncbi:hypothetical protein CRE_16002 [Caenorhabditis remanei]|uniref:C-type lectin domain-containing protein n=1 Tax=Caenorhabditis remanei TaxID=31234 RepID=E3MB91_CAERE|nr:hypothetical protein CRE_16002 [Caenorhabditis remanei]
MQLFLLFLFIIPAVYGLSCPPEYILVSGIKCLKMFSTPANHWEAEKNCTSVEGTLANIKNAIDNRVVTEFVRNASVNAVWIGLTCYGNNKYSCYWDDASGMPSLYDNFNYNEPSDKENGNCIVMSAETNWKWESKVCMDPAWPYVCEAPTTVEKSSCSQKYNYNNNCYTKSLQVANGSLAAYNCQNKSDTLVSIHSKMEVDYIRNLYKGTNTTSIYIGATVDANDKITWLDGTPFDFDYRNPLDTQKGDCVVMDVHGYGLWSRVDCSQNFEYLCKNPLHGGSGPEVLEDKPEIFPTQSGCNSSTVLAPGFISTFEYPLNGLNIFACYYDIVALGPYSVGIYFDFIDTYGELTVFDYRGLKIGDFGGIDNRDQVAVYALYNTATVYYEPRHKNGTEKDRGFHAVILPL